VTLGVTAVLFDADGVIQRAPHFQVRLAAAFGSPPEALEACVADIFSAELDALVGRADYAQALLPVLDKWGAGCSVSDFFGHWHELEVDLAALELVRALCAAGVYCALASNQEQHRARRMSERLGYREVFQAEFYSCHVGHAKPSSEYFEAVIAMAGLEAARTLFIDDREDNVAAARNAGLQAAQFELPETGSGAPALRLLLRGFSLPV
jgi:putative hydrolase of the HAD superfamily